MDRPRNRAFERAEERRGNIAPMDLIREARPGAVFNVLDAAIKFPGPADATRTPHATRPVIVVSTEKLNMLRDPPILVVVPCTASKQGLVAWWEFAIPKDEEAFDKDAVALPVLIQPILKSALVSLRGHLSVDALVGLNVCRARLEGRAR
jgi:mRNA-degrading endonuclease toxin of MazEF toxin-antitoxin module